MAQWEKAVDGKLGDWNLVPRTVRCKARTDSTGCPLTSTQNTMAHTPLFEK